MLIFVIFLFNITLKNSPNYGFIGFNAIGQPKKKNSIQIINIHALSIIYIILDRELWEI